MNRLTTLALLLTIPLLPACPNPDPAGPDAAVDAAVDAEPDAASYPFDHPARVLRVVDGDTLDVRYNGEEIRVRFLGVNTPELGPPAEPWAEEARIYTLQHAPPASDVGLEFDDEACAVNPLGTTCVGDFGRPLVYIRTAEGEDLNALLLGEGMAEVFLNEDFVRKTEYLAIEADAAARGVGIHSQ